MIRLLRGKGEIGPSGKWHGITSWDLSKGASTTGIGPDYSPARTPSTGSRKLGEGEKVERWPGCDALKNCLYAKRSKKRQKNGKQGSLQFLQNVRQEKSTGTNWGQTIQNVYRSTTAERQNIGKRAVAGGQAVGQETYLGGRWCKILHSGMRYSSRDVISVSIRIRARWCVIG